MRALLDPREARRIRALLVPELPEERRLLVLVREGKSVQAVRTDTGPLEEFPADLHDGGLRRAQEAAGSPEVDRVVVTEISGTDAAPSLIRGLLEGTIRTDPPFVPAIDRLRRLSSRARRWVARLVPSGVYGILLADTGEALAARIERHRAAEIRGGTDLRRTGDLDESTFVEVLRNRLGRPHLALLSTERIVRTILGSRRPVTALDRAIIREDVRVLSSSARVRAALFVLRLLGL